MPERQVYAIFKQFEKSGKFKTQVQLDALKVRNEEKYGHQMNITDMWPENLIKMEENNNDI